MGKTCSFFGQRSLGGRSQEIAVRLEQIMTDLIHQGVDTFFVGNHGEFDILSSQIACKLKQLYPQIQVVAVLCYPNELQYLKCCCTDFLMPEEVELAPKRACIVKRNQWVIDHSTYVISGVVGKIGGAYDCILYADKKGKVVIHSIFLMCDFIK